MIDSRAVQSGRVCSSGLRGEHRDGGEYAAQALAAGAWGVLVAPEHAERALAAALSRTGRGGARARRSARGPAGARPRVASASWEPGGRRSSRSRARPGRPRRRTSWRPAGQSERTVASRGEPEHRDRAAAVGAGGAGDTEVLVLEMAMRGAGQIAELAGIAEPDVGVIVNIGPVHLELLGSLEAIAAAKAELIAGMAPGATVVLPAEEPLLEPHRRADLDTVTFGEGGDVELVERRRRRRGGDRGRRGAAQPASVFCAASQPEQPAGRGRCRAGARRHARRGAWRCASRRCAASGSRSPGGSVLVNDCYNANPMSMRAAIDDLQRVAPARRLAVLGDMLELGAEAGPGLHREVAEHATARGVDVLVTVGRWPRRWRARRSAVRRTPCPTRRPPANCWGGCCARATRCS